MSRAAQSLQRSLRRNFKLGTVEAPSPQRKVNRGRSRGVHHHNLNPTCFVVAPPPYSSKYSTSLRTAAFPRDSGVAMSEHKQSGATVCEHISTPPGLCASLRTTANEWLVFQVGPPYSSPHFPLPRCRTPLPFSPAQAPLWPPRPTNHSHREGRQAPCHDRGGRWSLDRSMAGCPAPPDEGGASKVDNG